MIKILIQVKENKLHFQIRKRLNTDQKNLMNTNIISDNELVFSDEYIIENREIMHLFLKELIINNDLDAIVIKEFSIAPLVLQITSNIPEIKKLYLLEESILNYKLCERIINTNSINFVSLYNLPTYLLEILDKENITVESRCEILFLSNFMKVNKLDKFSSLYYKTSITIEFPFSREDEEDFTSFININKYLKTIYVNKVNKSEIENILDILNKEKIKNIKIRIKDNIKDIELIEYLKKLNKKNQKINNIQFKIDYSDEYLENNLINQLNLNVIKLCIVISLFFLSSVVFSIFYNNYTSMQKVENIQNDINSVIAKYKKNDLDITENININSNASVTDIKKVTNEEVASLLEINKDTVGWLKVNNTNVDYPVVQADDNEYYLNKNFKNEKDSSGWIFMDYRADSMNLSDNTIIFGHNMYYSGVMFGTLYKTRLKDWYENKENHFIQFDTLYDKMEWQIFSLYTTPVTNDYLISDFSSEEKFSSFIELISERSEVDFNINVKTTDKILTLSTCSDNGKKRLVIHAVLISDN